MAKALTCGTPLCGGQRFERVLTVRLPVDGPFGGIRNRDQVFRNDDDGVLHVQEAKPRRAYRCVRCGKFLDRNAVREVNDDGDDPLPT